MGGDRYLFFVVVGFGAVCSLCVPITFSRFELSRANRFLVVRSTFHNYYQTISKLYIVGRLYEASIPIDIGTAEQMVEMEKSAADEIAADDDFETQIVIDRDEAPDVTTEPHVAETTDVSQERQAEASPSATASPPPSSPPEIVQEPATTTTTEITTTSLDKSPPVNENRLSAGQSEVDLMSLLSPVPGQRMNG